MDLRFGNKLNGMSGYLNPGSMAPEGTKVVLLDTAFLDIRGSRLAAVARVRIEYRKT